ncbi:unnamed protein product [Fraxinus pennsylvanica]|uniref:TF-B3 domain-containing protein n=1 Tax=Fraxinus pennsylvanica TaxID=56036 RepID=A0AAD1Z946_9LAMI|nr:unnamed protein product [Fraxinus pennsylvanica]
MAKTVGFFKCYNPQNSIQRLKLPKAFGLQVQGAIPERAFLRDCYTNLWPVKVAKIGNDLFFEDGWEKFVQDNYVESWVVFVLQYDGENLFDVKLMGLSGCDMEGVGHFVNTVEDENEEDGEAEMEVADYGASQEDDIDSDEDDKRDDILLEEEERETEEDGVVEAEQVVANGLAPRPQRPYFVTKIMKKRPNQFFIPQAIINKFKLSLPSSTYFIDQQNRKWPAKLSKWKCGRLSYVGGWINLCRVNFASEEDSCICEFVEENGPGGFGLHIHVSVVRA